MIKKFIKNWELWLILIVSILIIWPLFLPGYFSHHDDLQVMRIFEMRKCFEDLQIPCRWVPDMGYGNGFPLFNYYSVLPYYIGATFSFIFGFIGAAKLLFFIPLVLGGFSMFVLSKQLFGKTAALVAAMLYLFAPYRALDSYVRGAIAESFALAIVPLVFYFTIKLTKDGLKKNTAGLAISLGAFLISHNIMTIIFLPVIFIWVFYFLAQEKFRNWRIVLVSLMLGFGLSIFFIGPAFLEKSLVQIDTLIRFDLNYRAHFATINQLFLSRFWGYGASIPGPNDTLSFQIGWPHWWLSLIAAILVVTQLITRRLKAPRYFGLFLILCTSFMVSVFMTHNRSAFVWEKIDILKFTQFPWRFLSLSIFSASLIGGYTIFILTNRKFQIILMSLIIVVTIWLNWIFFKPEIFYTQMDDTKKLSGVEWRTQQKAAVLDYLPKTSNEPKEEAPSFPLVDGDATVTNFISRSNFWQFQAEVKKLSTIEVPVFDFPNWQITANGKAVGHGHQNYLGRISFNLEPGQYLVTGRFTNTPVRLWSNIISLLSVAGLTSFLIYTKNEKNIN